MSKVTSVEQLREIYSDPSARAKNKVMVSLDRHAITLIENSHFAIISTSDAYGFTDISPKGGSPGFIKVVNESTLLLPDSSGNNRIDSLKNILANPKVGLMFLVNGITRLFA